MKKRLVEDDVAGILDVGLQIMRGFLLTNVKTLTFIQSEMGSYFQV